MRRLTLPTAFAAAAVVVTCAWYSQAGTAAAEAGRAETRVQLPLSGMATPVMPVRAASAQPDAESVLTPSCAIADAGACERLTAICVDLAGTMADNQDGTQTCTIVFD